MMASFTSAWLARSRVVVPRNPFLANSSIAACKISCRRSCFISKYSLTSVVSTYLRHLKDLCKEKQALESATKGKGAEGSDPSGPLPFVANSQFSSVGYLPKSEDGKSAESGSHPDR